MNKKEKLPNSLASLVLGIISVVLFIAPYFGLPLGILAIYFSNKANKTHFEDTEKYLGHSNAKSGRVLGIIGIVINSITLLMVIWALIKFGSSE